MNSCSWAASAAATTCSSVASGRPKAMFARTVVLKMKVSWRITPNWRRSDSTLTSRMSWPSTSTRPDVGS